MIDRAPTNATLADVPASLREQADKMTRPGYTAVIGVLTVRDADHGTWAIMLQREPTFTLCDNGVTTAWFRPVS